MVKPMLSLIWLVKSLMVNATDKSGAVYVVGESGGGFDGNTHSGYTNCGGTCPDMFLIKYNSDGVKQ